MDDKIDEVRELGTAVHAACTGAHPSVVFTALSTEMIFGALHLGISKENLLYGMGEAYDRIAKFQAEKMN